MPKAGKYGKYCKYTTNRFANVPISTKYSASNTRESITNTIVSFPSANTANDDQFIANEQPGSAIDFFESNIDSESSEGGEVGEDLLDFMVDFSEGLSKEAVSALLLSVFFNCRMTQRCMSLVIKSMTLIQRIELPSTFDGISKVLMRADNDQLQFKKRWYCVYCSTLLNELSSRFQRNCSHCDTK